jgi:hypothetical protein
MFLKLGTFDLYEPKRTFVLPCVSVLSWNIALYPYTTSPQATIYCVKYNTIEHMLQAKKKIFFIFFGLFFPSAFFLFFSENSP